MVQNFLRGAILITAPYSKTITIINFYETNTLDKTYHMLLKKLSLFCTYSKTITFNKFLPETNTLYKTYDTGIKKLSSFCPFFFGGNIVTFFKLSIEKNIRIDELPSTIFLVTIQQQNQDEGFFFFNFAGDRKFRVGYFQPQPIKIQTLPKIVIL
eukprot:TRINITY_DN13408_c0_g1_i6.p4 TRINITY_DN13408_c0_g1~~TRINITY_DN13408_c0_g1_i6.p4  ORF type:complete len:155 (+),score=0.74 TRINITY_DN13408_c0_g1_i6:1070-1534(+)